MTGGGQYEGPVRELREKLKARGIFVIVVKQDGTADFEVQIRDDDASFLPSALLRIAETINADINKLTSHPKQAGN